MKVLQDIISDKPVLLKVKATEKEMLASQLDRGSHAHKGLVDAPNVVNIMASATGVTQDGINWGIDGIYTKDADFTGKVTLLCGCYPKLTWVTNRKHGIAALYATQVVPPGDAKCMALALGSLQRTRKLKRAKADRHPIWPRRTSVNLIYSHDKRLRRAHQAPNPACLDVTSNTARSNFK